MTQPADEEWNPAPSAPEACARCGWRLKVPVITFHHHDPKAPISLQGTGLDGIIVPGTFYVYCNTTGSGEAASATNAQAVTGGSLSGDNAPHCSVGVGPEEGCLSMGTTVTSILVLSWGASPRRGRHCSNYLAS